MKTSLKRLGTIAGCLLLVAPVAVSAQAIDPDNVQNEQNTPDGYEVTEPAELPDQSIAPEAPEAPEAAEAPEASDAFEAPGQ